MNASDAKKMLGLIDRVIAERARRPPKEKPPARRAKGTTSTEGSGSGQKAVITRISGTTDGTSMDITRNPGDPLNSSTVTAFNGRAQQLLHIEGPMIGAAAYSVTDIAEKFTGASRFFEIILQGVSDNELDASQ